MSLDFLIALLCARTLNPLLLQAPQLFGSMLWLIAFAGLVMLHEGGALVLSATDGFGEVLFEFKALLPVSRKIIKALWRQNKR